MKDLQTLISILKDSRVFIQTHNNPDPDAISSAYGLQKLLEHFGISTRICYDGSAGCMDKVSVLSMIRNFPIELVRYQEIPDMNENDKIIIVDVQKSQSNITKIPGEVIACIDHHPERPDEYDYKDVTITGACASIIAQYYVDNHIVPERDAASALIYGIKMDTSDFWRGVTLLDIEMYAQLFPYADNELVNKMRLNTLESKDLRVYSSAIRNLIPVENIGYAFLDGDCSEPQVAMISDFILALDNIDFCIIYAQLGSVYKFAIRSELPELPAGTITARVMEILGGGGGGHPEMAGGTVPIANLSNKPEIRDAQIQNVFERCIREAEAEYKELCPV